MGWIAESAEWVGKKMIEPLAEAGSKLIGRGGKAGVEKAMEKIEPVIAKPKLTSDEAKAFLKAQQEAKAAKEAADAAKPLDYVASDTTGLAIQKSGQKSGAASAKTAEETTAAGAKTATKEAAAEGAAAEGKKLSWAEAQMLSSRFANKEAGTVGQRARKLVDGGYPEQAEKMIARMRARGFTGQEVSDLAQYADRANASPLLKKFAKEADESLSKRIPFTNIRTPGEFIASKWNNLKLNTLTAGPGVVLDAAKVPFLPMIWAGKAGSGLLGGSKIAGTAAAATVGYYQWDALKSVGNFLSFSSSDNEKNKAPQAGDGKKLPYEDNTAAKGMDLALSAAQLSSAPAVMAYRKGVELLNTPGGFDQARGAAVTAIKKLTHEEDGQTAINSMLASMQSDEHNFSDEHVALVKKFFAPETKFSDLKTEEMQRVKDSIEMMIPGADVAGLKRKFANAPGALKVAAAVGGSVASAGAGLGGAVVAAGSGLANAAQDGLEDLAGLNLLGQMAGIDTSNVKDIAKNSAKSMTEFAKKNPVAAGLGALFGMQTEGHGVAGAAKKGIMTVIFAGIINWVMNAMGINSGQVANMGKGLFNNVLGPVTGQHLNTTSTGSDHTGPRSQHDKKYFPFASEAAGMNRSHPQSAAAQIYNNGPAPQAQIGAQGVAPGEARPVQHTAPVITPPKMFQKTYGDDSGVTTSPVAPQAPDNARPLSSAEQEAQAAIAKAQQSSKDAVAEVKVNGIERTYGAPAQVIVADNRKPQNHDVNLNSQIYSLTL